MDQPRKSRSGVGLAVLAGLAVGGILLFSGSSKAATPSPSDPCKDLVAKANKILPTATAADLPALKDLLAAAKTLGCADLATTIDKKISDLSKAPPVKPPPSGVPKTKKVKVPSGVGPLEFSASYGIDINKLASLNPQLTFGVIHESLGQRIKDCNLVSPTLPPDPGSGSISGGINPEFLGSTIWNHTGQVDSVTNVPYYKNQMTSPKYRLSDGAGSIDCDDPGSGATGRTFSAAGANRFVKPWGAGMELTVPNVTTSVTGEVSVEGCIACELPSPKEKHKEEDMEESNVIAFGSIPFGGKNSRLYT